MKGWSGRILRVDLAKKRSSIQRFDAGFAERYIGGRGFAARILWDECKPGTNPLSPENLLIMAVGPLTGLPLPSSGKMVVAAKSPLTLGYGDGNLGTMAAVNLRRAGFDAAVFVGQFEKPGIVKIDGSSVEFENAEDLWGQGSFQTERELYSRYGKAAGVVSIGQAGENLVRFATIISQEGRSGGRPGMGAVMGSKRLKAVVIDSKKEIPLADTDALQRLGTEGYKAVLAKSNYKFWKRQGTMATVAWAQENSVLPTFNFRENTFEGASKISGDTMETMKVAQRGCPNCNMTCGMVVEDSEGQKAELDYENVVMLGSNIGLDDLKDVALLNRLADDYGIDTISLGNCIGFAMEASERKLLQQKLEWGELEDARRLTEDIAYAREDGKLLGLGTRAAAEKLGHDSYKWAMNIKGLEISGYDCHSAPGMALAFGTSPIGAHHKDAWVISWEVNFGRESYSDDKVDKVIEFQRIRGGMFEILVTCRFPWIELGFELDWYPKLFEATTGLQISLDDLWATGDRIYALIRAFWIREYGSQWSKELDYPPPRWFEEAPTQGPQSGIKLDRQAYGEMLNVYYERRGWNSNGVPTRPTFDKLGLTDVAKMLSV